MLIIGTTSPEGDDVLRIEDFSKKYLTRRLINLTNVINGSH